MAGGVLLEGDLEATPWTNVMFLGVGTNFMVRAIAEHLGVRMPSFGGFMLCSGTVVLPLFLARCVMFLRD